MSRRIYLLTLALIIFQICILLTDADQRDDDAPPSIPSYSSSSSLSSSSADSSSLVFNFPLGSNLHDPVELTGQNFFDLVLDSRGPWIVAFVAPWCGHCRNLKEPFSRASQQLSSTVRFGQVDVTVQKSLASQFKVNAFPTILVFPPGVKTPKNVTPYTGPRGIQDLVMFAKGLLNNRLLNSVTSTHARYPLNLINFFAGSTKNNYLSSNLPTLLVFLHTPRPSDVIQSLSQLFDQRLKIGIIAKDDKALRSIFRIRSTNPSFFGCLPARLTRTNETGVVECTYYDHTVKGGGSNVPAMVAFVMKLFKAATPTPLLPQTTPSSSNDRTSDTPTSTKSAESHGLIFRRYVIDESKTQQQQGASSTPSSLSPSTPPIRPLQSNEFHSHCTTAPNLCIILFAEPTTDPSFESTVVEPISRHVGAWNSVHTTKKQMNLIQLSPSSIVADRIIERFNVLLDRRSSVSPVGLLALFPLRHRYVPYRHTTQAPFDVFDMLDWLDRVGEDDGKMKLEKVNKMEKIIHKLLPNTELPTEKQREFFQTRAPPSSMATTSFASAAQHDEL